MKKFVSLLLALSFLLSLSITAFATEAQDIFFDTGSEGYEILLSENESSINGLPEEFIAPEYIYTTDDIVIDYPTNGIIVNDLPEDPIIETRATNAIYGPYSTLVGLDNSKMEIIVDSLKSGLNKPVVIYNDKECYKFTSGGSTLYLETSAIYKAVKGVTSGINTVLTNNANVNNTDDVYTYIFKTYSFIYNDNTVYRLSITKVSASMMRPSSDYISITSQVVDTVAVDVYSGFIFSREIFKSNKNQPLSWAQNYQYRFCK